MPWQPTQIALVDESQGLAEANVYLVNASRRDVTFTLPDPRQTEGRRIVVKKTDGSVNAVRIAVLAGTTVDGAIQYVLTTPQESVHLESDGRAYYVLKSHRPGVGGGGGGEANTSSNVGTGHGLALPKSGVNLPFKSLKAGANVTLTPNATEVEIAVPGGGPSPQTHTHVNHEVPTGGGVSFALLNVPVSGTEQVIQNGLQLRRVAPGTELSGEYSIIGQNIALGQALSGGQLWAHYETATPDTHAHTDHAVPTGSGTTWVLPAIPEVGSVVVIVNGLEVRQDASPAFGEFSISSDTITLGWSLGVGDRIWAHYRT